MVLWLVFTTGACNLRCIYCGGSFEDRVVPWRVRVTGDGLANLKRMVENDPEATVIFYGGEPLLNYRFIEWFINNVRASRWGIQTNGTLYRLLPDEYWRRMDVVLLSIDGRREVTDAHRGRGVYDNVISALNHIKGLGVRHIIARMAVTKLTDIYTDVKHLLDIGFPMVHWQLDVIWDSRWDLRRWALESYLPGIDRLVEMFLRSLEKGVVLGIVPILGVLSAYLFKPYEGPPCGAGYRAVAVTTDGRVLACPIAVREDWAVLGDVYRGFRLMNIKEHLPEMCLKCEYRPYRGGRCLYAIREGLKYWGPDGVMEVDWVTRETIRRILSIGPRVRELIKGGVVKAEDVEWIKAYKSVKDAPEPVDLILIIVPRDYVHQVLEKAGGKWVKVVIVITTDFRRIRVH
ncbi:MAG: TIGR04084 family radical SAM/SPASM domain-containing protein [Caldivirga sp.]|uniref:TIGR04084 family radical SAM/SPASM domain-containing protein n=3 Tax=Caldivirga sp. TaxID=2080243 RepID=UPI003D12217D